MKPSTLMLAFYGDDFTGSTDALEFLTRAGAKTMLFIEPPTVEKLARYQGLHAIGVAGMTRAMSPTMMEKELHTAFSALRALGVRHVHYKVCSTFDSSPYIGSIGKAIDIGATIFKSTCIPLLVAAPALGRYCAFGNLFARMGIGSQGVIHRLDRHPSMRKHPVTPADESDLREHLAKQTTKKIGLIDVVQVASSPHEITASIQNLIAQGVEIVLFDAIYENQLANIGAAIDMLAEQDLQLFSVGSSGVEMALGDYWKAKGNLQPTTSWRDPGKAEPLLVISGSCSPITAAQINWAVSQGFAEVALDTETIASQNNPSAGIEQTIAKTVAFIKSGRSVIIHSSRGADDQRLVKTHQAFVIQGIDEQAIRILTAQLFGTALGQVVRETAAQVSIKRIVIAGGDTSGYAARALGIEAVEMIAPIVTGAPLCKAHAPGSSIDGLEVNFKGGQVGAENYFDSVLQGKV